MDESERWLRQQHQSSIKLPGGRGERESTTGGGRPVRSEQQPTASGSEFAKEPLHTRPPSAKVSRDVAAVLALGEKRCEMGGRGGGERGGIHSIDERRKQDMLDGKGGRIEEGSAKPTHVGQSSGSRSGIVLRSQRPGAMLAPTTSGPTRRAATDLHVHAGSARGVSGHSVTQTTIGRSLSSGEHHSPLPSHVASIGAQPLTNVGLDSRVATTVSDSFSPDGSIAVLSMTDVPSLLSGRDETDVQESWVTIGGTLSQPLPSATSLGPNECTPSNRFYEQAEESEHEEPAKMLAGSSINMEKYHHLMTPRHRERDDSKHPVEDRADKLLAGGSYRLDKYRRAVSSGSERDTSHYRELRSLQGAIDQKDGEIRDLKAKLESKDERISTLNSVILKHQETAKRGIRSRDTDEYDAQMVQLSEQLSRYDKTDHDQKAEIAKLRRKVQEAEQLQAECTNAATQLSQLEEENKHLRQKLSTAVEGGAGGDSSQQLITSLYTEVDRLQPYEAEALRLRTEAEAGMDSHVLVGELQAEVAHLKQQMVQKDGNVVKLCDQTVQLQAEITTLKVTLAEERKKAVKAVKPTPTSRDDTSHLKRELSSKEERIATLEAELASLQSDMSHDKQSLESEVVQLRERVTELEIELTQTQSDREILLASASATSTDQEHSVGATAIPPGEVTTQEMERQLKEKDVEMIKMSQQLSKFKKLAQDLTKIVDHSKGQSRVVAELKQQLMEVEGRKDDLAVARESVMAELDSLQRDKAGLEVALISARNESDRGREYIQQVESQLHRLQAKYSKLKEDLKALQERERAFSENEKAFRAREKAYQDMEKKCLEKDRKNQAGLARLEVLMKEREHWQQKELELRAKLENTAQDLNHRHTDIDRLNTEVGQQRTQNLQLTREKQEFTERLQFLEYTAQAFKEDFEQERKDRETAHGQLATAEQTFRDRIEQLEAQLIQTRNDCQAELTARDSVHQTQVDKLRATIGQKDGELARANIHRQRLQEELQSKSQQVTHYNKKHDELKETMEAYKRTAQLHADQVMAFSREVDELKRENEMLRSLGGEKELIVQLQQEITVRGSLERKNAELAGLYEQLRNEYKALQNEADYLRRGLSSQGVQHLRPPPATPPTAHGTSAADLEVSRHFGNTYPPAAMEPQARLHQRLQPVKAYSMDDQRALNSRGVSHPPPASSHLLQSRHAPAIVQGSGTTHPGPLPSRPVPTMQASERQLPHTSTTIPHTVGNYQLTNASVGIHAHVPPSAQGGYQRPPEGHRYLPPPASGSGPSSLPPSGAGLPPSHVQSDAAQLALVSQSLGPGFMSAPKIAGRHTQDDSALPSGTFHPGLLERDSPPSSFQTPGQGQPAHDQNQQQGWKEHHGGQQQPLRSFSQQHYPAAQQRGQPRHPHQQYQRPQVPRIEQQSVTTNAALAASTVYARDQHQRYPGPSSALPQHHATAGTNAYLQSQQTHGRPGQTQKPHPHVAVQGRHPTPSSYPMQETRPPVQAQAPTMPSLSQEESHHRGQSRRRSSRDPSGNGSSQLPTSSKREVSLDKGIDSEIEETAEHLQVEGEPVSLSSDDVPFDPNLICPTCGLRFRLGQIQKFRKHVSSHVARK